jgi:hypothetical protein
VSPEAEGRAGFVEKTGKAYFQSGAAMAKRLDHPEVGERYLQSIAKAVSGSVRRYERAPPEVVGADGRAMDLAVILDHAQAWRQSLVELIEGLRAPDELASPAEHAERYAGAGALSHAERGQVPAMAAVQSFGKVRSQSTNLL